MHPSKTVSFPSRTTFGTVLAITLCAYALCGCAPGEIASSGGETFGSETAGDGDPAATGDSDGPHIPEGEERCVEMSPGSVTCWVGWTPGVDARTALPCQAAEAVTLGIWGPAYEAELELWGLVLCHQLAGSDASVCLYGDARVVLTEDVDGWAPVLSAEVAQWPSVGAPCGVEPNVCGEMIARAAFVNVECPAFTSCVGTWDPCGFDSAAVLSADLYTLPPVEPVEMWPCAVGVIEVDACVEVDPGGHRGCFWFAGDHAVAVAPVCAVEGLLGWHHVGAGMMAREF